MKKLLILIGVIIVVAVAWYLIAPVFQVEELDEASPLDKVSSETPAEEKPVNDALDTMTPEKRAEFDAAVEEMKDVVMEMAEEMPAAPSEPVLVAQGEFVPRAHGVEGRALLISHPSTGSGQANKQILRFEDFETINGPNLHIYLSTDLSEDDFIDLGSIRATKGNVNYEIDASIDTEKYNNVLVWCVPFRVLFSYAELKK